MAPCSKSVGIGIALLVVVGVAVGVGVGLYLKNKHDGGGGGTLPLVTPPVLKACPPSLKSGNLGQSADFSTQTLDPSQIHDRFFDPMGGPTSLFRMLSDVDARIQSINDRWSQFSACMASTPVAYSLGTSSWASSPPFYAQCSELWSSPVGGFDQWAQVGSTTYLYVRGGDEIVAAEMVGNGTFGNIQKVTIWYSVGVAELNRSNVSHCVAMVYAEPNVPIFELSAGGSNIGYCGVQLKSDGTLLNVTGSADFGTGCSSSDTSCTLANSISTPASCSGGVNEFSLPALGRKAYGDGSRGASAYPGGVLNTITLANMGNDDSFFGPSLPTV